MERGVDFLSDSIEKIRPKELARNMVYDIMSKAERITKESIEKYFKNDFVQKAIEHSKLNKLDKGDLRNFMETITEAKQSNRELTEKELECVLPIAREVGYIKPWQNASVKLNEFCTGKKAFKKPTKKGIQKFDFIKKYAKVELKKDSKIHPQRMSIYFDNALYMWSGIRRL